MNKIKFLITIIIVLVISNAVLLFMMNKDHNRNHGPKNIIIEKLHLDRNQIKNYEVYIQKHRKDINENEAIMKKLRGNLFEQLKYQQNSIKIDSLILIIAKQQIVAEHINYNHFLEIKKICKSSQQKDFNDLTNEIVGLFSVNERK